MLQEFLRLFDYFVDTRHYRVNLFYYKNHAQRYELQALSHFFCEMFRKSSNGNIGFVNWQVKPRFMLYCYSSTKIEIVFTD